MRQGVKIHLVVVTTTQGLFTASRQLFTASR